MSSSDESLEQSAYDGPVFTPVDPASVERASTEPDQEPEPGPPQAPADLPADADLPQPADDDSGADDRAAPPPEPVPEFDARWREEFTGLLYLGALSSEFTWLGHHFVVRTLTTGELAEVALAAKRYEGTDGAYKAYQAAVVAAAVVSVDGQAMPSPLTTDPRDTPFLNRYRYVMRSWYPPVLDAVYQRYFDLEIKVREVIEAMGNRSG